MMDLSDTFFALSDPTRRAIVERLLEGDATVSELAKPFDISAPAISKHLRALERAGLLEQRRVGKTRRCRLLAKPLVEANGYLDRYRDFWEASFDRLASHLEKKSRRRRRATTMPRSTKKKRKRNGR